MEENHTEMTSTDCTPGTYDGRFDICIAICDANRGFGLVGHHPWPKLPTDFKYYLDLTGVPREKGKIVINIKGRQTWEGSPNIEKSRPIVKTILISRTLRESPHRNVESVHPSFQEALNYLSSSRELSSKIESVWIMGGEELYNEALKHPACRRVHLTRIYGEYRADRFLDEFESRFQRIDIPLMVDSSKLYDENGVQYRFEVYERK